MVHWVHRLDFDTMSETWKQRVDFDGAVDTLLVTGLMGVLSLLLSTKSKF